MMGTPVLILGDSGAGKSYSLRNFNPDDVMLLQCIPKMLPFKSAGWKLHGKLLPDGSKQRGNVLRSDNWETVLDTIYRMVQSKTRRVLIIDDVFDTGLSLAEAVRITKEAGASEVLTCVFARKPWPKPRAPEPDFVGWEAPNRFLVGYGLDHRGGMRGLPDICALD